MAKVYIHGANATVNSWNYIRSKCGDGILVSYDSHRGFENNLEMMKSDLSNLKDMQFIAHSLGGIYALHLADYFGTKVTGGVTLSTPYGGHHIPFYAKAILPWYQLLHDVGPTSWPFSYASKVAIKWPWCNVVTISGSVPWIIGTNDGVVTVSSQRARQDIELIDLKVNHYEVVLNQQTADIINLKLS